MCEFLVCDVQGQRQGRNEHRAFLMYGCSSARQLLCSESLTLRYYLHPLALATFQAYLLFSSVICGARGVCSGAQFDPVIHLAVYSMSRTPRDILGVPL